MLVALQNSRTIIAQKNYCRPLVSIKPGASVNREKKKILLIDDEEVILFGFRQALMDPWLQVDTASTADEAKALLKENVYSAAIVDMRLSNSTAMEGLDLIPYLKTMQKNCRIIVLTAYSDEPTRRKAFNFGADIFLEKPVDPETLKKNLAALGV
jgi:DNA-binding NtrC family response regulator